MAEASELPSCEQEAIRVKAAHPLIWTQAGDPSVECGAVLYGREGLFDNPANTIRLAPGLEGVYGTAVAHELGHAWLFENAGDLVLFARVRGHVESPYSVTVMEDYAETFAYALGEWGTQVETVAEPPYRFQTVAGVPSEGQLAVLRVSGVLPMVSSGCPV